MLARALSGASSQSTGSGKRAASTSTRSPGRSPAPRRAGPPRRRQRRVLRSAGRVRREVVAVSAYLDHVVGEAGGHFAQRRGERGEGQRVPLPGRPGGRLGRPGRRRRRARPPVAAPPSSPRPRPTSSRAARRRSASAAAAARRLGSPGCRPAESTSRLAVLATQLARVAPESSVRSPVASSYQVSSGRAGSAAIAAANIRAMLSAIVRDHTQCPISRGTGRLARRLAVSSAVAGIAVGAPGETSRRMDN